MNDMGCDGLEVYDEIGHGATSVVYKGRYGGKDVAVKVMNQDGGFEKRDRIDEEIEEPIHHRGV